MNYYVAIDNIRDDQLDLVEDMWELRQTFLKTVKNLTVRQATQELSPILADYCSLRENIITMIANMDKLEEELILHKYQQRS